MILMYSFITVRVNHKLMMLPHTYLIIIIIRYDCNMKKTEARVSKLKKKKRNPINFIRTVYVFFRFEKSQTKIPVERGHRRA